MGKSFILSLLGLLFIVGSGFLWLSFNVSKKKKLLNKLLFLPKERRFFWYLLQKEGFEVLSSDQIEKYSIKIDGETKAFSIKADFIVKKRNSKYAAIYTPVLDEKKLLQLFFIYSYLFQTDGVIFYNENSKNYTIWQEE